MNFLRVIDFTNGMTNIKYCFTDNYIYGLLHNIGKEHHCLYYKEQKKKTKTKIKRKISNSSKSNNRTD